MKNIAIIAEYNPLHNGHKYQIDYIRKELGADNIIVIMSGNFVQRGEPAIFSKTDRTIMALRSGADMVIELPCVYATGSAEFFAKGSIDTLEKTGIVNGICFGAETPDVELLNKLSTFLIGEPSEYQTILKSLLADGMSYPTARANACRKYLNSDAAFDFLNNPNNILALEYVKELKKINSSIEFYPLKRTDKGYNSTETSGNLASASAIRNMLAKNENVSSFIPDEVHPFYESEVFYTRTANDYSQMLHYALLSNKAAGYEAFMDCTEDLSNRILTNLSLFESFDQFADLLKTKNVTRSRINRVLIHILLNIKEVPDVSYIRLLGIKKEKTTLISNLMKSSSLPVINNVNKDLDALSPEVKLAFERDMFATDLYHSVNPSVFRKDERSYSLIKL